MHHVCLRLFLSLSVWLLATWSAHAEDVLDHLPPDALGFAVVHDLSATSTKLERLLKVFEDVSPAPIPAPLPLIKAATGLGDGLDDQGDALLAALPQEEPGAGPRLVFLVPVSEYARFAASIKGDPTGEICRVTIADEEVLVAQRGSYAVLMNVEHRARLEALVAAKPRPAAVLAPLADWIAKSDFAVVLTAGGVKMLAATSRAAQQTAELPAELQPLFTAFNATLTSLAAETNLAGIGVTLDERANLWITHRLVLENPSPYAAAPAQSPSKAPLHGFANAPFVIAGGGQTPEGWSELNAKVNRHLAQQYPEIAGLEGLDADGLDMLEKSWRLFTDGVHDVSFLFGPGQEEDQLLTNGFCLLEVDDPAAYLAAFKESFELYNKVVDRSKTELPLKYDLSEAELDGAKGVVASCDLTTLAGDPNTSNWDSFIRLAVGDDGRTDVLALPAGERRVVLAFDPLDKLTPVLAAVRRGETSLTNDAHVQTTLKLLNESASWKFLVSPQGCVAWGSRVANSFFALTLFGEMPDLPEYPPGPPWGLSIKLADGQFAAEMAWPIETLKSLAAYIKKCETIE